MPEQNEPIASLGAFIDRVSDLRKLWKLSPEKELWFRGESKDYHETSLRPELYRPGMGKAGKVEPLKPIPDLLSIEYELCEEFQRCAVELCNEKTSDEEWDWDFYFLTQHHGGPTRLLDWSDGALNALHFALRDKNHDDDDARVYVLEPYRLMDELEALPDRSAIMQCWKSFIDKHPGRRLDEDDWDCQYLPQSDEVRLELSTPRPPLVLDFPHFTRRIAAQRSRFVVFGTDPNWLSGEFKQADSTTAVIESISIEKSRRPAIRQELRDCGVTESVIYPDLNGLGREMKQLWEDRRSRIE